MEPAGASSSSALPTKASVIEVSFYSNCLGLSLVRLNQREAPDAIQSAVAQLTNVEQHTPQLV